MRVPLSTRGAPRRRRARSACSPQRGIVTLLVEGGAELAGSFLAARLADELHAFIAPILLGPRGRPGAVDWAGPDTPQQAPRIASPAWELVGEDAYVHGALVYPEWLTGRRSGRARAPVESEVKLPGQPMIRTILHYPDKRLRERGEKIEAVTPELQQLIDDMAETMYAAPGVGLAATQIGEALQLFIIDIADEDEPSDLRVFINPEILERDGRAHLAGGLPELPGVQEDIDRAAHVRVRAQDRDGKWFELEAEGLLAVAIQHEYDHLQGVLMIDHMGPLKKRLTHRKMVKRAEEQAAGRREARSDQRRPLESSRRRRFTPADGESFGDARDDARRAEAAVAAGGSELKTKMSRTTMPLASVPPSSAMRVTRRRPSGRSATSTATSNASPTTSRMASSESPGRGMASCATSRVSAWRSVGAGVAARTPSTASPMASTVAATMGPEREPITIRFGL